MCITSRYRGAGEGGPFLMLYGPRNSKIVIFFLIFLFFLFFFWVKKKTATNKQNKTTLVAHLDARPTGDQEVAGSTPTEVGNSLSWRLIVKYFLSFSPFPWFKKGSCQFLGKECTQYWLTA